MKYLKTYEEISPEYIQGKIAGKPDSPQKDRLQDAANKMIRTRTEEEQSKKYQQAEEEKMKNPGYKKRIQLCDDLKSKELKLLFSVDNSDPAEPGDTATKECFELSCKFKFGHLNPEDFYLDSEFAPLIGEMEITKKGNYGYYNNYKATPGPEVAITNDGDLTFGLIITKDGIQLFEDSISSMKEIEGKISLSFEHEKAYKFVGLKLVGMDLASKNTLATFIKQYVSETTTGNNNLKVNGIQIPVFEKDFTVEKYSPLNLVPTPLDKLKALLPPTKLTISNEPVNTTEEPKTQKETIGGKIKSFLGFEK